MNTEPGYSPFSPVPNTAVDPSKVPSIYNKVMDKLSKVKNVSVQPRVKLFNLSVLEDRQAYEELMHTIHSKSERFLYVGAKDHWTKEGDFMRAIDYVEFFEATTEKEWKEKEIEKVETAADGVSEEAKGDLKKELDAKTQELSAELSLFDVKKPEDIKKEIEADQAKMDEAIEEQPIAEEPVVTEEVVAEEVEETPTETVDETPKEN